jgi:predicted O-methyltransferase YrrM
VHYIGDLSKEDATLLQAIVRGNKRILEFGMGGSTHSIALSMDPDATFTTLDTAEEWIGRTKANFASLGISPARVTFGLYGLVGQIPRPFDLVFDDGLDSMRLPFALAVWDRIPVGGILVFHDARRDGDLANVLEITRRYVREVARVDLCTFDSNLAVVEKGPRRTYRNWNTVEGREPWESGCFLDGRTYTGPLPPDFLNRFKSPEIS